MSREGQELDLKSIRYALGKHAELDGLACDCVGFANASGGAILLGIENNQEQPPAGQQIDDALIDSLRKRIPQVTVNVSALPQKRTAKNGGEYVEIRVGGNQQSIASTSDGRYFLRVADETRRLLPDDLGRLMADRNSLVWELAVVGKVPASRHDAKKLSDFVAQVRASDRVSAFVRNKSDDELLEYYLFVKDGFLTNLGVLWIGRREDRAALLHAPVVQCIKYDERERKVRKWMWDDYSLNPKELIQAVWDEVPDWRESYEIPDGLFRKNVPHYDEVVVRELLANALVHRPYWQRGDIFVNLYPERLEVHNPGLLPIGVTPHNILHASSQRNQHLAKVFYDLKLMEKEGSGFDRMYEVLLMSGKATPVVQEGNDRVMVTIEKRIVNPAVVDFVAKADQEWELNQRERIVLGLVAQQQSLTATEMARVLELKQVADVKHWLGRLGKWKIILARGRTKGTEYFVSPTMLQKLDFRGATTLRNIESHRLQELIRRDLEIHREAGIHEIHERIGPEIPRRRLREQLRLMLEAKAISKRGEKRNTVYYLTETG